jgi:hypothetical protein
MVGCVTADLQSLIDELLVSSTTDQYIGIDLAIRLYLKCEILRQNDPSNANKRLPEC